MKQRTQKTRLLCLILTLSMLLACVTFTMISAEETGDGTAEDSKVLEIGTAAELLAFDQSISNTSYAGWTVKLTADINLNEGWVASTKNEATNKWTAYNFDGTFDGQGHTISGLYCVSTSDKAGMFKSVYNGGGVKNLKLTNSYIRGTKEYVGSICGSMNPTNCVIENVWSDAIVEGYTGSGDSAVYLPNIGGIVGGIYGNSSENKTTATIKNAVFEGTVSGNKFSGGIVGYVNDKSTLEVENCVNYGTVNAIVNVSAKALGQQCGGIIGDIGGKATLTACINFGDINGYTEMGGVVGSVPSATAILVDCINYGTVTANEHTLSDQTGKNSAGVVGSAKSNATVSMTRCINAGKVVGTNPSFCDGLAYLECRYATGVTGGTFTFDDCYAVEGMSQTVLAGYHNKYELTVKYDGETALTYNRKSQTSGSAVTKHDAYVKTVTSVAELANVTAYSGWAVSGGKLYPSAVFETLDILPMKIAGVQELITPTGATTTSLRLIGLVNLTADDLQYWTGIGFTVNVTYPDGTTASGFVSGTTVYSKILADEDGTAKTYTATNLGATYLSALTLNGISTTGTYTIEIIPYVDSIGGTTFRPAEPTTITVKDGKVQ